MEDKTIDESEDILLKILGDVYLARVNYPAMNDGACGVTHRGN